MFFFGKKGSSAKKTSHFDSLSEKWTARHRSIQEKLWEKNAKVLKHVADKSKQFAAGSLAGLLMMASPTVAMTASHTANTVKEKPFKELDSSTNFLLSLHEYLPQEVQPLTPEQEQKIGEVLSSQFGLKASAELNGIRLNRSYGYIGQEQHLKRYPGDGMENHFSSGEDAQKYFDYGMAPGLGAYGYFAKSASSMTPQQDSREKYYVAVQTFLAPGYLENTKKMNEFFAFHKMLIVNPDNGRAIIADIGDSGPAEWTGKSLGGSPEVMNYLQRVDGAQKGPVLYFFIDDPNNTIPLGPITTKS